MANMRGIMPAIQRAQAAPVGAAGVEWLAVEVPKQARQTRVVENRPAAEIARELAAWIRGEAEA
jgi:electron transfer flavoprotein beta subunit